jgi:hypothetical protein
MYLEIWTAKKECNQSTPSLGLGVPSFASLPRPSLGSWAQGEILFSLPLGNAPPQRGDVAEHQRPVRTCFVFAVVTGLTPPNPSSLVI